MFTRLMIVDDHPAMVLALKSLLHHQLGFEVIDSYDAPKMGKKGSGHFEIWAKSNPHGPAFWRQIPREDWMRNHEWQEGQRHTFFKRKKKPKKLATI